MRSSACPAIWMTAAFLLVGLPGAKVPPARADDDDRTKPIDGPAALTLAGKLVCDQATDNPAFGSLPVDFVPSPDATGGRYLVAVNSGYGLQFDARTTHAAQSLAVLDFNAAPAPTVL